MITYLLPICLNCQIDKITFENDGLLRSITEEELERFFGVTERKIDKSKNTFVFQSSSKGIFSSGSSFDLLVKHNYMKSFLSNYVYETQNEKTALWLNATFKLYTLNSSGLFIEFIDNTPNLKFIGTNPYYKNFEELRIQKREVEKIRELYKKIKQIYDKPEFNLVMEYYQNSLSGEDVDIRIRFLNLVTILEILILKVNQGELKFRLGILLSRLLSSNYPAMSSKEIYEKITNSSSGYYSIRSKITHTGKSSKLTEEVFKELANIVRLTLLLYVNDQKQFQNENLISIALQ